MKTPRRFGSPLRIAGLFLLFAVVCVSIALRPASAAAPPHQDYVGSEACASCHAQIYRRYRATSMGRSITPITLALLPTLQLPAAFDDPKLDRHYAVFAQDGKLLQSEFQTAAGGADVFRETHAAQWQIGAGVNGFGVLVERSGYLFQGPLSFYSKPMRWDLSPGYEFADYGFTRPILPGCIVCHSGRFNSVAATNGRYEAQPFSEAAIGCEQCHGPGGAHVRAMAAGRPSRDPLIVNPAYLSSVLANNICMECHQTGDVRVLQPGRHYADFRPGQPLGETLAILKVPPTRESPPDDDHVEHYYSMTLSRCYRASGGRLRCTTCHDPHGEPTAAEAPAWFNSKCLTCHTQKSCTLSLAARHKTTPADNCIGCHMPQRDVRVISHSSATNHRIVRTPSEAFPDITFNQTTPALPDLILLDPVPGQTAPPALTLLQAYGELAGNRPEYVAPYLRTLDQLSRTDPENALVQAALGRRELQAKNFAEAVSYLRHSLRLDPAQPAVAGDLADALTASGQAAEALPLLTNAVDQDPFNPVLQKKLIVAYIGLRQFAEARTALEHYLQVFPQDSFMRQMLARAGQAR